MKTSLLYICDFCGRSSKQKDDILACEAGHYGLSLEDYLAWKKLDEAVKRCSYTASYHHNEDACKALDDAIDAVLAFERAHGLEGRRLHG